MKKPNRKLRAVDLFCGCGGLTAGLKQSGFDVIGAIEIDLLAGETYSLNHPEVKLWTKDVRTVSTGKFMKALRLYPGKLDVLAGCPPCQGFSAMRRLNGPRVAQDHRNNLLFDYLRFVRALRPKTILMENVPGLSTYWRWPEFKTGLKKLGYEFDSTVLNAVNFGVPQRRRRLILVGARSARIPIARPSRRQRTVKHAIKHLPLPADSSDPLHKVFLKRRSTRILRLFARIPKNGGSRSSLGMRGQLDCHKQTEGFHDVYGRMAWNKPAPTITTGCINPSKGRFLHPTQNRPITLREAALLQTFPRRYKFSLRRGRFAAAAMIGNALPPRFIARHARPIRNFLEKKDRTAQ